MLRTVIYHMQHHLPKNSFTSAAVANKAFVGRFQLLIRIEVFQGI